MALQFRLPFEVIDFTHFHVQQSLEHVLLILQEQHYTLDLHLLCP